MANDLTQVPLDKLDLIYKTQESGPLKDTIAKEIQHRVNAEK